MNGRMNEEIRKALLHGEEGFFRAIEEENPLYDTLRELMDLRGVPQNPQYHPEGDAFEHTMHVLCAAHQLIGQVKNPLAFMCAALTHDLGKAVCTVKNDKGNWTSIGHDNLGAPMAERMLLRMGASQEIIDYCKDMVRLHMRAHICYYNGAKEEKTDALFDRALFPRELCLLAVCDARGKGHRSEAADAEEVFLMQRLESWEKRKKS